MNNNIISHRSRGRDGDARRRARASTELRMGQPRMGGAKPFFPEGLDLCRVDFLSREPLKNMGVPGQNLGILTLTILRLFCFTLRAGCSRLSPSCRRSRAEMAKQVQYLLNNGWTPCIELKTERCCGHLVWFDSSINSGYYDNRTGSCGSSRCCTLRKKSSLRSRCAPRCSRIAVRVAGFDNIKQVNRVFLGPPPAV